MVTEKEEMEVLNENLKEAIEEAKQPDPTGKIQGIIGIIIGVLGLFLPLAIAGLFAAITATLGIYANKHGQRTLGIICGILALLGLIFLLFSIKY